MRNAITPTEKLRAAAFGQRLQLAMDARDLNQSQLAKLLGCNQSNVSSWLNTAAMPLGHLLARLPGILRVDANWLLTGDGTMYRASTANEPEQVAWARGGLAVLADLARWVGEQRGALTNTATPADATNLTPEFLDYAMTLYEAGRAANAVQTTRSIAAPAKAPVKSAAKRRKS